MTSSNPVRFLDRTTPPHVLTLILLAGVSALAMNIFLPSLPGMAAHFDAEYQLMQLSVGVYLGISGLLQTVIGPLSDKLGRRPVILWGLMLFLVATLGCILAPNVTVFLFFRMCQAVVAVAMVLSRAAVRDMYPVDKAASMIGYITMGMTVVPMFGPMLGGALDQVFGWQASFWMLIVLGGLTLALTYRDMGETHLSSGLTLMQQFSEYPELLRAPRFWAYSLAAAFSSGSFFAYLGGAPFVGSEIYGLNPTQLGIYFAAPAVGYFAGNFLTGVLATRVGVNRMILWGGLLTLTGMLSSLAVLAMGWGNALTFFGFMSFVGLGNGMAVPNATSGMMSVRPHLAGTASGLGGAIMLGGGAALSVLAGFLLSPETGAYPLIVLMATTSTLAVLSIRYVIYREKQLGL
ncbi:MAG: multidrug effflux MFS transporter [Rhodobacteraceae bacterium]|nr:multidrug effflux MFS transporter [Paracoccaceae bacterium]